MASRLNPSRTIELAKQALGSISRSSIYFSSQTPLFYYPNERAYLISLKRGYRILSAWITYDKRRDFLREFSLNWFGSKVLGPLWLHIGIGKQTGQMRTPIALNHSRTHIGKDFQAATSCLQVFNNFVNV